MLTSKERWQPTGAKEGANLTPSELLANPPFSPTWRLAPVSAQLPLFFFFFFFYTIFLFLRPSSACPPPASTPSGPEISAERRGEGGEQREGEGGGERVEVPSAWTCFEPRIATLVAE